MRAIWGMLVLLAGCSATVVSDGNDPDVTCDWRFLDGCIVGGEDGDACQTESFCQDGLRCNKVDPDPRTWVCEPDDSR